AATVEVTTKTPLSEEDRKRLERHLLLAESLGAEVVRLSGHRVSDAILACARKRNITRIMVGKPHRRRLFSLRPALFDELVRKSGDIEVQVVRGGPDESERTVGEEREIPIRWRNYGAAALAVA